MATKKGYRQPDYRGRSGSGGYGGNRVYDSTDVGHSGASGESVAVALGLIVCMVCLVGFITLTGFLYADLQAARGANKMIERKIKTVIERCDRE